MTAKKEAGTSINTPYLGAAGFLRVGFVALFGMLYRCIWNTIIEDFERRQYLCIPEQTIKLIESKNGFSHSKFLMVCVVCGKP